MEQSSTHHSTQPSLQTSIVSLAFTILSLYIITLKNIISITIIIIIFLLSSLLNRNFNL
jgi:hypothetical protein